jgi:hypothetical protein
VSALTQRPSWRALGRNHEDVKGFHLPELFAADPGHGERFVAEGAGVLDYTKNRRTEQEVRSEALPRRSCLAADASSAWFLRAVVLAGPLSVVALIAGWVVTEVGRQSWVVTV